MKIFAQDGYGPSDKIDRGCDDDVIQGSILSPRYRGPDQFEKKLEQFVGNPHFELYLDPKIYAAQFIGKPNAKLGKLEEWGYFEAPRRPMLITGKAIPRLIEQALKAQKKLPLSGYIAPNIYVDSANSIDAAIALNIIGTCRAVAEENGCTDKPLFASLILHRDVLSNDKPFSELVEALTGLDSNPDGFYVIIGSGSTDDDARTVRSDLYHDSVIAGWMYINYVLSINGFKVINGYSDLLSPLLGICGACAGSSGWYGTLRQFSIGHYIQPRSRGGSQPLVRYLSKRLLTRIKQTDYDDYKNFIPDITNNLASDDYFKEDHETERSEEVLQSWDALNSLCSESISGDIDNDLDHFRQRIGSARLAWSRMEEAGLTVGVEAQLEKLQALEDGIFLFKQWAELD